MIEYMSQQGYDELVAELNKLIKEDLPKVISAVSEARDKGDLSENFEYHAAKREQSRLLGTIRFKQNILANARVLTNMGDVSNGVQLLCTVELTNIKNKCKMKYTIVNPHEANLHENKISIKSPIAQALLNRKIGETVKVTVPAGFVELHIDDIKF